MDAFFASADRSMSRNFREAISGTGATVLRGKAQKDPVRDFALSTAAGLASIPRRLESRFLYDSQGSELFDLITEQPEYYLTRTEAAILANNSGRIRDITGRVTLVELGSGSSIKTDYLLRAWLSRDLTARYVPVDVSDSALQQACRAISTTHPNVQTIGVHSDYYGAFPILRQISPALVLFLGSTIGNFAPLEMSRFLKNMAAALTPGDFFLVGIDLVKDKPLMEAAYNDAAGVTGEFTRNLFARMNRELRSNIELSAVEHEARYNNDKKQIEIHARFTRQQTLRIMPLDENITIAKGERVNTEVSRKFDLEEFLPYVEEFGFATEEVFTDDRNWFALILLQRMPIYANPAGGMA